MRVQCAGRAPRELQPSHWTDLSTGPVCGFSERNALLVSNSEPASPGPLGLPGNLAGLFSWTSRSFGRDETSARFLSLATPALVDLDLYLLFPCLRL